MAANGSSRRPRPASAPCCRSWKHWWPGTPGCNSERKSVAVAIHYRQVPELELLVRAAVADVLRDATGLEALPGKMVVEIKPAGVDKGDAIAAFMRSPPFAGRMPLFAGDDVTDEAGFVVVRELGGVGLLVGQRATAATVVLPNPDALRGLAARIGPRPDALDGHPGRRHPRPHPPHRP